ncbi:MAG: radical SAM protein [Lachnospiraceae bacterium]|nr:radical SAM protein [Lachnospiraceae bacterium]
MNEKNHRKKICADRSEELKRRLGISEFNEYQMFPKYFMVGTVNYCNAHCTMCPHRNGNYGGMMMEDKLFVKITQEMSGYNDWIEQVALYWFGEPTLDKKIVERIRRLKDAGIRSIQLSTNAELLNEELAVSLLYAGLDDLRLSIDAFSKETYKKIRLGLDYNKVIENANSVINIRNNSYSSVKIQVRFVEQDFNHDEVEDFREYWENRLNPKEDKVVIIRQHTHSGWDSADMTRINIDDLACVSLFSTMVIDSDGKVPLCCLDTSKKISFGDLNDQTIKEIWGGVCGRRFVRCI